MINTLVQSIFGFTTPKKCGDQQKALSSLDNATFDPSRCIVHDLPDEFCFQEGPQRRQFALVIENLLTKEECAQWIAETESLNYETALVNVGGGREIAIADYRKSLRVLVDDTMRCAELWDRVKHFIPSDLRYHDAYSPKFLNERLRFLRYDPGDFFMPHRDGYFEYPPGHVNAGDRSYVTFQLYLNDGFSGGSTRVFLNTRPDSPYYDVVPKAGSVFLFEHSMQHSGERLLSGRKYAVRTDVMFSRRPTASEGETTSDVDTTVEGAIDAISSSTENASSGQPIPETAV